MNVSSTISYAFLSIIFLIGFGNIFSGIKLLTKSIINKNKYFKAGVIFLVLSFLSGSLWGQIMISILRPIYSLGNQINDSKNIISLSPTPYFEENKNTNANWKTYTNTEKGYSIAFPKEQFVRINCPEKEFWLEPNSPDFHKQEIVDGEIRMEDGECNRSFINHMELNTFLKSLYKPWQSNEIYSVDKKNVTINDIQATKYKVAAKSKVMSNGSRIPATDWTTQIVIEKDNNVYVFTYDPASLDEWDNIANQILSTFRFIDEDETLNWIDYTYSELKITFKLPPNWKTKWINQNKILSIYSPSFGPNVEWPFSLYYLENPDNLTLEQFEKKKSVETQTGITTPGVYSSNMEELKIENIKAFYNKNAFCEPAACPKFVIPIKKRIYILKSEGYLINSETKQTIQKILSTFKFLDNQTTTSEKQLFERF